MRRLWRRLAAAGVALALLALVATDLWTPSVKVWWDGHSLTGSIVSSLLVLAVTGLIVDEVVARRQRRERSVSVAVQGLIVYGQARRAYDAVVAKGAAEPGSTVASDELRALAGMLLTASPSLFDDPEARRFLEDVERFSVSMVRTVSAAASEGDGSNGDDLARLASEKSHLQEAMKPLLARIPSAEDRALLEGAS
jgi:hypothetical protein